MYKELDKRFILPKRSEITAEEISTFFQGKSDLQKVVNIELSYDESFAEVVYYNEKNEKKIKIVEFKPFCWAKKSACDRMFGGNKNLLSSKLREYGIWVKPLKTCTEDNPYPHPKVNGGYKFMFYATKPMSQSQFQRFFKEAGTSLRSKKRDENDSNGQEFMTIQPVEQFMIQTGIRYFKGYNNYDEIKRMAFDLETEGLDGRRHLISQIGIRTNYGFEKIITVEGKGKEKQMNQFKALHEFFSIIRDEEPDVLFGHNTENFDWDFIIKVCEACNVDFTNFTSRYFREGIYKSKREACLKLGGEVETYYPTVFKYTNMVDSLHGVRRAQATDSSFEKANLKYATKYLHLNKPNRVYVPGDKIESTWLITDKIFAFNDNNGDWYKITEDKPLKDGYVLESGRYIVERYLLDDIWEADKVELTLHETDFQFTKIIPTTFTRVCTMGTATQWKLIMLAWAYEQGIAVPCLEPTKPFTGGLSRLLVTGYMQRIVKLDYNSLYPSSDLTWNIESETDIEHVLLPMLHYVLTTREHFKGLKKKGATEAERLYNVLKGMDKKDPEYENLYKEREKHLADKVNYDNQQMLWKKLGNSFFGSFGCPSVFPWASLTAAEKTTCIGRMLLRLMIGYFSNIGKRYFPDAPLSEQMKYNYTPIVGDTDGFDFQLPEKHRYTEENPYIGLGLNRESKKDKKYSGCAADVAEFCDIMLNKTYNGSKFNLSGLGIDEYVTASINISRKNYLCLMEEDGSIKKVGNTMKSRKMSGYLQRFINTACDMLIKGDGHGFLEEYYKMIDDIYNYRIPVKEIASKGNIKKSLDEYKKGCQSLTKSGAKKSRQAWYELAIQNNLSVNPGDTVYYVNIGTKKGDGDVKREVIQYIKNPDNPSEIIVLETRMKTKLIKAECEKEGIEYKTLKQKDIKERIQKYLVKEEDKITMMCKLVPNEIVNSDEDLLCSDVPELEYNVGKYIEQFNKRIKPLLVCFSTDIRDQIMITNPSERPYWTKSQTQLVHGCPMKETDEDKYEVLMKPERKEMDFWTRIGEEPPFWKECGMDWPALVAEHEELLKKEEEELFQLENNKYLDALASLTKEDVSAFEDEGKIPEAISKVVTLSSNDMKFYFINIPDMTPNTGGDVFNDIKIGMNEHGIEMESESIVDE